MKHYIKNAKQCFTDDKIRIFKIRYHTFGKVRMTAQTRNRMPDVININEFYITKRYFNKLIRDCKPYLIGANFY